MQFAKEPPPRKRKRYKNPVTDSPAFLQLVRAMRKEVARAALSFDVEDAKTLKVAHPWRVATDALRRLIRTEGLPYRASKYQTESGGWAVQVVRTVLERGRIEEGRRPAARTA